MDVKVSYKEFMPHDELQDFIYCYWELKTERPLEAPFTYRVVTDGCINIFMDLNNPSENFVMGFCKKYTEFTLDDSFHYIGIRFLPTMFPQFFGIDASLLSNRFQHLSHVAPGTSLFLAEYLRASQDCNRLILLHDEYFLEILQNSYF